MEGGLSRAELVASLAPATDLAMGHPLEQGLGACLVATRMAELAGLPPEQVQDTYYLALLRHIGCTTGNQSLADLVGGDEVELSAVLNPLSGGKASDYLGGFLRYATAGRPVPQKVRAAGRMLAGLRGFGAAGMAICEVARALAARLDRDAVDAVLAAAGHRIAQRKRYPGGLTAREVQVLRLLARGVPTRDIARTLVIAPKTAGNHIQSIYAKAEVTTRAAATVFAMRHGLLEPGER